MSALPLPPVAQLAANALQLTNEGTVRMPTNVLQQLWQSLDAMNPAQRAIEGQGLIVVAGRLSKGDAAQVSDGFAQLALLVTVASRP